MIKPYDPVLKWKGALPDVTLRDLFAAFSLAGRRASGRIVDVRDAYRDADAMLAVRNEGGEEATQAKD